jgi:hypothetical protein
MILAIFLLEDNSILYDLFEGFVRFCPSIFVILVVAVKSYTIYD